jgi:hypothetical protein
MQVLCVLFISDFFEIFCVPGVLRVSIGVNYFPTTVNSNFCALPLCELFFGGIKYFFGLCWISKQNHSLWHDFYEWFRVSVRLAEYHMFIVCFLVEIIFGMSSTLSSCLWPTIQPNHFSDLHEIQHSCCFYKKWWSKLEVHKNWLSDIHTLLKGTNEFLHLFSMFFDWVG